MGSDTFILAPCVGEGSMVARTALTRVNCARLSRNGAVLPRVLSARHSSGWFSGRCSGLEQSWPSRTKRDFATLGTQTHGGDDVHRVSKLVCDFSVTTNALGPV